MNNSSPDNIEEQIGAFRADLEGLTAFDAEQIHDDVQTLATAMRTASTHDLAAAAVRDFYDSRAHDPLYARAIIASALSLLATTILIAERVHDLPRPDGLLARLQRLSLAVRAVGVGIDQLRHMYGGA